MKNHIYKIISALLLGSSVSVAIASAPKSVRPHRTISRTMSTAANKPYDHLRGSLENLYGSDGKGGKLVTECLDLLNQNYQLIRGNVSSEELTRLGLFSSGAINPELLKNLFICKIILMPKEERMQYFDERFQELRVTTGTWVESTIVELEQIQERVERREISWTQVDLLYRLNLLTKDQVNLLRHSLLALSDFKEEEEEEEEAYLTGELD